MLRRIVSRLRRGESGQEYVEFAFILLPLMLMIMGLVDFGRVFNTWLVVTHGAREGARYAAIGADYADVEQRIADTAPGATVQITIAPPEGSATAGQPITVTVATTVELLSKPLTTLFGLESYDVVSMAAMRYEGDYVSGP